MSTKKQFYARQQSGDKHNTANQVKTSPIILNPQDTCSVRHVASKLSFPAWCTCSDNWSSRHAAISFSPQHPFPADPAAEPAPSQSSPREPLYSQPTPKFVSSPSYPEAKSVEPSSYPAILCSFVPSTLFPPVKPYLKLFIQCKITFILKSILFLRYNLINRSLLYYA
jgi:hypothetical protein